MRIQFIKNVHFTRLVKINGRSVKEFNFRKINGGEELFSVDVSDDRGNRIMFQMNKEGNIWHIIEAEQLPAWITTNETRLHELIEEEIKNI